LLFLFRSLNFTRKLGSLGVQLLLKLLTKILIDRLVIIRKPLAFRARIIEALPQILDFDISRGRAGLKLGARLLQRCPQLADFFLAIGPCARQLALQVQNLIIEAATLLIGFLALALQLCLKSRNLASKLIKLRLRCLLLLISPLRSLPCEIRVRAS
jgi:hypothetical protein